MIPAGQYIYGSTLTTRHQHSKLNGKTFFYFSFRLYGVSSVMIPWSLCKSLTCCRTPWIPTIIIMVVILVIMRIAVGELCSVVTSRSGELWVAEQSFIFGHIILPTWLCLPPSKQSGIIGTLSWRHDGTEGLARFFILDSVSDHLPITSSFQ